MKGSAKVIKNFAMGATFALVSWSSAEACSPSSIVITGEQNYAALKPNRYASWNMQNMSIGLVYVKGKRIKNKDVPNNMSSEDIKRPFVKVKFKLIEDISGDFTPDEKRWIPKISASTAKRELALKTKGRNFAFWDRSDLSAPSVSGYAGDTSCGPMRSPTLLPNQYYLQFKKNNQTVGMEIVSGPDDPLVREFTEIFKGSIGTQVRRRPKDYFKHISGYQEITLKKCPTEEQMDILSYQYSPAAETSFTTNIFSPDTSHNSDFKSLKIVDFIAYQKRLKGYDWQCLADRQYLVLDKVSPQSSRGYRTNGGFHVNPPQHRYVEIHNGQIDTQDILSQISIIGAANKDAKIDVTEVKSWIEEANPK